jgi:hypothetical protein
MAGCDVHREVFQLIGFASSSNPKVGSKYAPVDTPVLLLASTKGWCLISASQIAAALSNGVGKTSSPAGGCVYIIAATLKRAKTFRCEGCGGSFPHCERVEVAAGNLTFFEGDPLCGECAHMHEAA